MEEETTDEERKHFNSFCVLLITVGRKLLRQVVIDTCVYPKESLSEYLKSKEIINAVYSKCTHLNKEQLALLYPPGGALSNIKKFNLPLLCTLIVYLGPSDGDSKRDSKRDYKRNIVRNLVKKVEYIHHCYNLNTTLHRKDERYYEQSKDELRDIYRQLVSVLPKGEKSAELSQLIEDEGKCRKDRNNGGCIDEHLRNGNEEQCFNLGKETRVTVVSPNNPRPGEIIKMTVKDMKMYCKSSEGMDIGSFGTLYKRAKINKEVLEKYLIKELKLTDKDHEKTYYTELHHETILHPHVVPIIAYAEDVSKNPRVVYLMYPYMEKGSVRDNILFENEGNLLSPEFRNCKIWLRCMYQVGHALDYLHKQGKHGIRGPIFHRDLTSLKILFNEDFNAKLCDFGKAIEAKHTENDASVIQFKRERGYHPSNVDQTPYKASFDVYSFCVVILEILTGDVVNDKNPFADYTNDPDSTRLLQTIKARGKKSKHNLPKRAKVVKWDGTLKETRNKLAQKAWEVMKMDGANILDGTEMTEVQAADFVKMIEAARLESYTLYKRNLKNDKRCASCYINPTANLPLKGKLCKESHTCTIFCVHCLSDPHNELICPFHGPTRPPLGNHVYGVFVAGNHTKDMENTILYENTSEDATDIAKTFLRDAKNLRNVLISRFPLVLGAREEHLKVVRPKHPGKDGQMLEDIKRAFDEINIFIGQELSRSEESKLEDSLFIFYFTGHSDKKPKSDEYVMYLGGMNETINCSEEWLKEMLHDKLRVDKVLVILDCCHAATQVFAEGREDVIVQLSSCAKDQKSRCTVAGGSYFTHFLCKALAGDFIRVCKNHIKKCCQHCEKKMNDYDNSPCGKLHLDCLRQQYVTLSDVQKYIVGHYKVLDLPMDLKSNEEKVGKINLAYYKPYESTTYVLLEGSQKETKYTFSAAPISIGRLRKDIIEYIGTPESKTYIVETKYKDKYNSS
ncbi:hypothetical protein CHS0354_003521 [Potamilus streckersoni]|uniref:Protein kinase domain-containing protein n=1 Tax=Potamilus streckersoni TaxID=2493646 RepID=A0AAE0SAZ6_9BIVA|nr:hypothetical protein CHS0354_003521 [Potamilus streckersoni]